jgi:hypothetical protein
MCAVVPHISLTQGHRMLNSTWTFRWQSPSRQGHTTHKHHHHTLHGTESHMPTCSPRWL